jgi:hypothetical protein
MRRLHLHAICSFLAIVGFVAPAPSAPPASQPAGGDFLDQVKANFAGWDTDHDGELSATEIELAVHDPRTHGASAAAAAALRRAIRADSSAGPFTLEKIKRYIDDKTKFGAAARFEPMYEAARRKIDACHRVLFVSGAPKLQTLAQGRLGDCFLLATLGSLVEKDPQRLTRMLTSAGDGNFAADFPGRPKVLLPLPTDAEVAIGATTQNDGTWANAFETAVGQVLLDRQKHPTHATPYSIIGVGGSPHTVMEIITGHKVVRLACEAFQGKNRYTTDRAAKLDEFRDKLAAAQSAGRLIVGGTAGLGGPQVKVPGLYYNHSYAVLKYDRATDVVSFWNPMGNSFAPVGPPGLENGYETSHGRFEAPLTEAVEWFGAFSLETDEAL